MHESDLCRFGRDSRRQEEAGLDAYPRPDSRCSATSIAGEQGGRPHATLVPQEGGGTNFAARATEGEDTFLDLQGRRIMGYIIDQS